MQFALESEASLHESLSSNEYTVIAVTSFCLGLMYIASVFLYIYLKKKKDQPSTATSQELNKSFSQDGEQENSSFCCPHFYIINISSSDSTDFPNLRSSYRRNSSLGPSMEFIENPEPHVVKSNPLMKHFMGFNENGGFMSDSSDAESSTFHDDNFSKNVDGGRLTSPINSDSECLPEEDVSITEENSEKYGTMNSESSRSFHNGTVRRKLYFNPAYFEPSLLASPPPSAIEFLTKIREVITIAKNKMASKRYQPSLNLIPEEFSGGEENYNQETMKSKSSIVSSSRRASSKDCAGCPGCDAGGKKNTSPTESQQRNCKNCGDKRKTIQKWLENVSSATSDSNSDTSSAKKKKKPLISLPIMEEDREELIQPEEGEKTDTVPITKGFVKEKNIFIQLDQKKFKDDEPETTGSIPKIISHSLKKNIRDMFYSQNFVRDKVHVFEAKKQTPTSSTPTSPLSPKSFEATEIYNNPKFNIDSNEITSQPQLSASRAPYSTVNKVNKKSTSKEVLDQYAALNPLKKSTKVESPLNQIPDMIYEAIEMERKNKPQISYPIPTPDYSSEYEMTKFKNYDPVTFVPFVPTPDYHTYGKNTLRSLKHYQPDSPIYSRKSPAYLVVDYETDSLERLNTMKRSRTPVSPPTSRSDFSSQPSPSALPMEEEVEIRNAIYDREEGFRKDSDTIKKEREIDIQMKKSKIMYNTPNQGSMTIELEGVSPDDTDALSTTDSDQFEPDTLDRHARNNKTVLEKIKMERKHSMEKDTNEATDEMGRLMTLETRHSRRQRQKGFASLEKLPELPRKIVRPLNPPPDVISSNKPSKDEIILSSIGKKGNVAKKAEHEFKKSLISLPIENEIANRGIIANNAKSLRGEYLKMDLLKLDTNFHENQMKRNEFEPSLIKTVYHVELPPPPKIEYEDSNKKSKDLKNAWRRLMGFAEKTSQDERLDNRLNNNGSNGKVKDIIKRLNVNVHQHVGEVGKFDSGYLSSESISNDASIESAPKSIESVKTSPKSRPSVPPPPVPSFPPPPLIKHNYLNHDDLVNINIYSSDDEPQSSIADESDDDGGLLDDGTESGTESWKFFKT